MTNIKIEIPEGYEIDTNKSTFENIVFKEIVKPKYQIGDYVRLTDTGWLYSCYSEMSSLMGFKLDCFFSPTIGDIGYIFAIENHLLDKGQIVYGVEMEKGKIIINNKGFEKITQLEKETYLESIVNEDDWFTIYLDSKWMAKGSIFKVANNYKHICFRDNKPDAYSGNSYKLCNVNKVHYLRKSTQEEIDNLKISKPEWFKPDYEVGDFVIVNCSDIKYIGIYGGNNGNYEVLNQYMYVGGSFAGSSGGFNKIERKANSDEIYLWLKQAQNYYGNKD